MIRKTLMVGRAQKRSDRDTLTRQLAMLNLIPHYPDTVSVPVLHSRLGVQGYATSTRTIQRDLIELSRSFPLSCEEGVRPYRWGWSQYAQILSIPDMAPVAALGFCLAETYVSQLLPKATLDYLSPHFTRARRVLQKSTEGRYRWWERVVRVVAKSHSLIPAMINPEVQDTVYHCLFKGLRFEADYTPRSGDKRNKPNIYEVNPLGLIFRQGVVYLVCTLRDYTDVRQLVLHRIARASILKKKATVPSGFTLDEYIAKGKLSYLISTKLMRVVLRFDEQVGYHLYETPLSATQKITRESDGSFRVSAQVMNTIEFRNWLLGFGGLAEVISPKKLRLEFHTIARKMHRMYRDMGVGGGNT